MLNAGIFAMIKLIENILFINVTKAKVWDFVTKIVLTYCEKKMFQFQLKLKLKKIIGI